MRYSKQREVILKCVHAHGQHPCAESIYDMAKKELPRISLATVYRNLNQLAQQGEISKLQGIEGKVHFDHNAFEHSHFICHKCKTIIDIPHEAAADLKTAIYEKTGLMADSCQICCKGLCPKCQQRKN